MPSLIMTPKIRKRLATKPLERTRHGRSGTPTSKGFFSDVVNYFSPNSTRISTRKGGKRQNTKRKTQKKHRVRRNQK